MLGKQSLEIGESMIKRVRWGRKISSGTKGEIRKAKIVVAVVQVNV
jgi:hypothetical protein